LVIDCDQHDFHEIDLLKKTQCLIRISNFEKVKVSALHITYFYHSKKVDCVSVFYMQDTE
jgi:penicillin-binding protein-related factor A (putative recombinase)